MTHKKKKTLSDNISFLLSSANGKLVNPDEDINTESQARVVDEEDLEGDLSDTAVAPSKLRQKNVALLDSLDRKYRGGVTSRKALKGSDSESEENQSDKGDSENDDVDDGESDAEDFDDSEEEAIADIKKKGSESFASFTDFNDDEDNDDEDNDDEDNDDEDNDDEDNDEDEDRDKGEEEGSEGSDEDTTGGIQHFSVKDTNIEVKKGQAVRNQLAVWDTLMECRIQLQKVSTFSNQLPQPDVISTFHSQGGGSFHSNLGKAENSVTKLLDSLLILQEKLLKQYPETRDLSKITAKLKDAPEDNGMDEEIPSSDDEKDNEGMDEEIPSSDDEKDDEGCVKGEASGSDDEDNEELNDENEDEGSDLESDQEISNVKRKNEVAGGNPTKRRKLDEYSGIIAKHHKEFRPYLNSTIQKWNTKTQVAVGRANSKNFSAFEQSTLQQIEHILADKGRLIRRTQLRRSDFKILGRVKKEEEKPLEGPTGEQPPPDVPTQEDQKAATESSKEYDPEIFDDTDFYHQLLRELIEKKTADVTDPVQLGRQWIQLQKMRSKMKRKVDVKASKGRRLRYSVHPKLVNFMAPQPELKLSDDAKNELFASLFGQRKT